jgi:Glycosyl hydrolase family 65, C-terminal domain
VPTESTLAGFYAQAPGQVQQRANLPAWSTLAFSDGAQDFSLGAGQVAGGDAQTVGQQLSFGVTAGGAFTFTTGIGGFLQEFLYGYPDLRWSATAVDLAPSLTAQLGGVVLHNLMWHGRVFTVAVGPRTTTVSAQSGGPLPVTVAGVTRTISPGQTLTVPTRRPDLSPTSDLARCQAATVRELTANTLAHTSGPGQLSIWATPRVPQ